MRYVYAYRDKSGVRRKAWMDAGSREAVFAALRANGVRAIKVEAADGSKANGEVRAHRARAFAFGALAAACAAVAAALLLFPDRDAGGVPPESGTAQSGSGGRPAMPDATRRYPIGDAAVVERGILTGWRSEFDSEGDRFLASFAVPGAKAAVRNTTVEELEAAVARSVPPEAVDRNEARQIKTIVEGMKAEAREYVRAGGTLAGYASRLVERQDAEIAIYEKAKDEIERAKGTVSEDALLDLLDERNDGLRKLGIRPITLESLLQGTP